MSMRVAIPYNRRLVILYKRKASTTNPTTTAQFEPAHYPIIVATASRRFC